MAQLNNYPFDEYLDPTVVDPTLSSITPVKSHFAKPTEWTFNDDFDAIEPTQVEFAPKKSVHFDLKEVQTPWENLLIFTRRAIERMKKNLRT